MDITLTDKARARLQNYELSEARFLRLSVQAGGCSGMTYDAVIDESLGEDDEVVHQEGPLRIVADARSALFLDGLTVDYSDDLIQAGFRLTNPNAKKSCGCGASFAV